MELKEILEGDNTSEVDTESHFVVVTKPYSAMDTHHVMDAEVDTEPHFVMDTESHTMMDTESITVVDTKSHTVMDTESHSMVDTKSHPVVATESYTMVDTDAITMVLMGLGCLVLSLCVLLATILIYQHCRCVENRKL